MITSGRQRDLNLVARRTDKSRIGFQRIDSSPENFMNELAEQ
jgi:hypothetical protein